MKKTVCKQLLLSDYKMSSKHLHFIGKPPIGKACISLTHTHILTHSCSCKFCLSVHKNSSCVYHQKWMRNQTTTKWDAKSLNDAIALKHSKKISFACILSLITKCRTKTFMFVVAHHNNTKWAWWRSIKENQMTPQYRLMTGIFKKRLTQFLGNFISMNFAHVNSYRFIAKLMNLKWVCERACTVMRVGGWNFPYS